MQTTGLETQIVQGLAGVVSLAVTGGIAYVAKSLKGWIGNHTNAQVTRMSNEVIDGLGKIADAVAHDFNDRIIRDAQTNGTLTPQLFEQVKTDAVRSVVDQSPSLVGLGTQLGADVQSLAFSLVAQSFNKLGVAPTIPAPSVPPSAS